MNPLCLIREDLEARASDAGTITVHLCAGHPQAMEEAVVAMSKYGDVPPQRFMIPTRPRSSSTHLAYGVGQEAEYRALVRASMRCELAAISPHTDGRWWVRCCYRCAACAACVGIEFYTQPATFEAVGRWNFTQVYLCLLYTSPSPRD